MPPAPLASVCLAVAFQVVAASPSSAAPARALSWELARSLAGKLEALERRLRLPEANAPERVVVTQAELNSYLNLSLAEKMPPGLKDVDFAFERGRIAARALVDLEQVRGQAAAAGPWSPLGLLSGSVLLEVAGRYRNGEEGFGLLEVEAIHLASFPVPVSLLEQVVGRATQTSENPGGFDIHAPFRLPYRAKRVRVQRGQALLEF